MIYYDIRLFIGVTFPPSGATVTPSTGNLDSRACTFEQPSICGYTQDKNDRFDWTRNTGGTQTGSTGPASDHTYGTRSGQLNFF